MLLGMGTSEQQQQHQLHHHHHLHNNHHNHRNTHQQENKSSTTTADDDHHISPPSKAALDHSSTPTNANGKFRSAVHPLPYSNAYNTSHDGSTSDTDMNIIDKAFLQEKIKQAFHVPPFHQAPTMSWLSWMLSFIPMPIIPICHEERLVHMLVASGEEAKYGLINELSTHILIDCLFLTITSAPIYGLQLQDYHNTALEQFACIVFYGTFQVQLVSILLNATTIFALVEVPADKFQVWSLQRLESLVFCARFHLLGLYSFFVCAIVWPMITLPHKVSFFCVVAELIPWCVLLGAVGTSYFPGYLSRLNPIIKYRSFPNRKHLFALAKKDRLLYRDEIERALSVAADVSSSGSGGGSGGRGDATEDVEKREQQQQQQQTQKVSVIMSSSLSLADFLTTLDLHASLYPRLRAQEITTIEMLAQLHNDDYRDMGVIIGHRLKIQNALAAISINH